MKNFSNSKNYQNAQPMGESMKLPAGAYVIEIKKVEYINGTDGNSDQLRLMYDIAEGEYKDFFVKQYQMNTNEDKKYKGTYSIWVPMDDGSERDNWTMRKFKTAMNAFEDSNVGYTWTWDETTLKGKKVGAVFNEKEWEFNGRTGFFTNLHHLIAVNSVPDAKIPEPTRLKNSSAAAPVASPNDWVTIPDGVEEELPFA